VTRLAGIDPIQRSIPAGEVVARASVEAVDGGMSLPSGVGS
jgi:hypothetical protein